ncbi:hypothetical protein BMS3Abin03_01931 [bacterium BMS3Abin03]|nr:hypothetical protein BMS3Abin03_01931 [bacterium BMS3Abin03]
MFRLQFPPGMLIMNLIRKDSGKVTVFGSNNIENEEEIKSLIGFVYDKPNFYDDLKLNDLKKIIGSKYITV